MKSILLLLVCSATFTANFAQDRLYYFINPTDSLVGVKNNSGKIIIPPQYVNYMPQYEEHFTVPITDSFILMVGGDNINGNNRSVPSLSAGDMYDRKGNLLYHPLQYDNGPDFFTEELTRCVGDHHQAGFVNREGKIVIEPQYDWVSQFNYGYAFACKGCTLNREVDPEHPTIVYKKGADTFYINREGQKVRPAKTPAGNKDHKIDDLYLPYPFTYSPSEQKLIDSFNSLEVISKIAFMNFYSPMKADERNLQFEIIGRPAVHSRVYKIMAYNRNDGYYTGMDDFIFLIDEKGNWYHESVYRGKVPFHAWLKNSLKDCKEYFKENPDAPNKFDADRYLKTK